MDLKDLDLNLLVVFNELQKHGRVAVVAQSLGIATRRQQRAGPVAQTADELFLRTARGMVPTPYAQSLARPIADALGALHSTLNARASFDPRGSERGFVIGVNDVGESISCPG